MTRSSSCALLAALLVGLLAPGSAAFAQDPSPPPTAPPDRRIDVDFQRYYTAAQLQAALEALASAYPELVRLESLGRSRGGRELWVVTVARRDGADPARKGALLVVGGLGAEDPHGVEMALFTLLELVQNHERDQAVARALAQTTLYVVPCLDPDLRAALLEPLPDGPLAPRAVELDRNFPAGWSPWEGGRGGSYPLSEPETRALVEFLAAHPNVAVVQSYAGRATSRAAEATSTRLPDEDRATYAALMEHAGATLDEPEQLEAFPDSAARGGSFLTHAVLELGAFGFASVVAGRDDGRLPQVVELYPLSRRAMAHTLLLAGALPQLAVGEPAVQRLRSDLWQVDVAVVNRGLLPTASALARARRAVFPPRLEVGGAKLVASALRGPGEEVLRPLARPEPGFNLPEIPGGARVELRLVLFATAEASVDLAVSAPRAGTAGGAADLR